ncbi:SH3 domain-containing protein [Erwinia tracheiphila]|uniref:SH3 domain-containing protein n=2 Tax=Erwinia tracheiphila TaxID=65700 RepID=A0A345CRD5_9GAMM|nr:SH3 domain-containing protein [Erwinia tracheiphila]AXF76002.1 SH3 domain-containing protein [Erwinia tracheiphila]UIA85338.1 SH3 domain-containing protein [Erwinia tracheiphila]UIA86463.1 SH3 domain-containing protein [Erwinia tracheiphila]UIA93862.1 SH3 domain-containing protein [Erwinia tracheiphila]UIA94814.1 SH3 domain-containing protein [Erwinia tracheiphila]
MMLARNDVKFSVAFTLLTVLLLTGCQKKLQVTDDTLISTVVDGVTLMHRHAIVAPLSFTPVNETYRALYSASVMDRPGYGGQIIRHLENGKSFTVLGEAENHWLAITDDDLQLLTGYVPFKAGVKSELYDATLKSDRPKVRKNNKKICVDVGDQSKACRNNDTETWILE